MLLDAARPPDVLLLWKMLPRPLFNSLSVLCRRGSVWSTLADVADVVEGIWIGSDLLSGRLGVAGDRWPWTTTVGMEAATEAVQLSIGKDFTFLRRPRSEGEGSSRSGEGVTSMAL